MEIQTPSKSGRGGSRPGSGRPKDAVVKMRKSIALGLLTPAAEKKMWKKFLNSADEDVALKAFLAWNERAYGKVAQPVDVEGELTLVIDI